MEIFLNFRAQNGDDSMVSGGESVLAKDYVAEVFDYCIEENDMSRGKQVAV